MLLNSRRAISASICLFPFLAFAESPKPTITLDQYLNTTDIVGTSLAPDASAAVIATESPDWKASVYRHDLWLWTAQAGLKPLTHSGTDEQPRWSPDGRWIAFVSDRAPGGSTDGDADTENTKCSRIWLISASGGEALPLYSEKLDVHAFAWSSDSSAIYFSAKAPLTHEQEDAQKDDWKDVVRWREQYRGDILLKLALAPALARAISVAPATEAPTSAKADAEPSSKLAAGAETIAKMDLAISEIAPSPDGKQVAFLTEPIHKRIENPADYEIFLVGSTGGNMHQITHNQAVESDIRWSPDNRWIHFSVNAAAGSLEGKYRDVQGRLYRIDPASARWSGSARPSTARSISSRCCPTDAKLRSVSKGTETQVYLIEGDKATKLAGNRGQLCRLGVGASSNALLRSPFHDQRSDAGISRHRSAADGQT